MDQKVHLTYFMDLMTYSCWDYLSESMLVNGATGETVLIKETPILNETVSDIGHCFK